MINGLHQVLGNKFSKTNEKNTKMSNIVEIHKNRIKNEIERLKSNQCKLSNCGESETGIGLDNDEKLHFHVNNVTIYSKTSKNYILIEISLTIDNLDSFNTNTVPVEIILYKDFPFGFPDIIFPTTCCFPSLSDGRSFTVEILNNSEWSPSKTLLDIVGNIRSFLILYNKKISTVGASDLYIGSYRSPISFNYRCSNSLIYPILESNIKFTDELYSEIIDSHLILKSNNNINKGNGSIHSISRLISQNSKNIAKSLVPIPLNTRGITRETSNWKFEKPFININFVFNNTNIILFDSILLIIENNGEYYTGNCNDSNPDNYSNVGIISAISNITHNIFSKKSQKTSSSSSFSDEILSDSSLCGNVVLWFYLSTITHIFDNTGKLIFGNKGTVPNEITEKISKLEYSECIIIIIGYDLLHERSNLNFYFQNELIKVSKDNNKPIIIKLKFHNSKAKHENSCCLSFANNIRDKVKKIGNYFPDNCYNPNWDSYFQLKLLENINNKYQNIITSNHINLCSDIIYKWVTISSKLIELTSFISETDDKYYDESNNLVKIMQQVLISSPVKNILHSRKGTSSYGLYTSDSAATLQPNNHSHNHSLETDVNSGPSINTAIHGPVIVESIEINDFEFPNHNTNIDNSSEDIDSTGNNTLNENQSCDDTDDYGNIECKKRSNSGISSSNTAEKQQCNHIQLHEDSSVDLNEDMGNELQFNI
ncbi:hypothetical protein FG379_002246 [Cryptosporidium bovis]|uniref:uncharacterized protein n=1 Tax=Cryptosporidium bovis TaxID=310047 RepID=UPI00351A4440|nr:hypothetical protein FG379_002246 [Cryptosporidium bovis]